MKKHTHDREEFIPYEGWEPPEPMGWGCIASTLMLIGVILASLFGGFIALIQWITS